LAKQPIFPRPPATKGMVDFVVLIFVLTVSTILIMAAIGLFVFTIFLDDFDSGPLTNSLADIMTTMIGALIGFIAGKGQGHIEGREAERNKNQDDTS
jgi:hypothetical protein